MLKFIILITICLVAPEKIQAQSNSFLSLAPVGVSDIAVENILPGRLQYPDLKKAAYPIAASGKSVVGLRLTGVIDSNLNSPTNSRLILPLKYVNRLNQTITLKIGIGIPNSAIFSANKKGDLSTRPIVKTIEVPIEMREGDLYIVVQDFLNPLLASAISHSQWNSGNTNSLPVFISRTDSGRGNLSFSGAAVNGNFFDLQVCSGICPLLDQNLDGKIIISCIGDSNTSPKLTSWCKTLETLGASRGWITVNHGVSGAYVIRSGAYHLRVASGDRPDAIVMAYGTNDAQLPYPPQQITDTYKALFDPTRTYGARPFAALAPPNLCYALVGFPVDPVLALNELMTAQIPSPNIIDFYSVMNPNTDYKDCIHMNELGQQKRAQAAFLKLLGH